MTIIDHQALLTRARERQDDRLSTQPVRIEQVVRAAILADPQTGDVPLGRALNVEAAFVAQVRAAMDAASAPAPPAEQRPMQSRARTPRRTARPVVRAASSPAAAPVAVPASDSPIAVRLALRVDDLAHALRLDDRDDTAKQPDRVYLLRLIKLRRDLRQIEAHAR